MESVSEALSQKFKNMSIVCAILVVFIHISMKAAEPGEVLWVFSALIPEGISRIGVPFFFLASGYFLAGHIGEDGWWKREVCKRIRTLLVPFILWNIIHMILSSGIAIVVDLMAHRAFGTSIRIVQKPELCFQWLNPVCPPYLLVTWYIRSLFALIILAPVIVWALKRFPRVFIFGAWVGSLVAIANNLNEVYSFPRFVVEGGLAYFSLGIFLRKHPIRVEGRGLWVGSIIIALVLLALLMGKSYTGRLTGIPLTNLSIPFMLYAVWGLIPAKPWAKGFTSLAFACYLMHSPIIRIFERTLPMVAGGFGIAPEVCDVLVPWLLIVISVPLTLLLAHAMHRYLPRASVVLFGGR